MGSEEQRQLFNEIIEQHKGIFLKVAGGYCRDDTDRQDLIQEIMIQIWRSLPKFNGQSKMSTWLYRISLNVAISFYRRNTRRAGKYTALDEKSNHFAAPVDCKENERKLSLLEEFISELKEIDKALMILYLEDKSYAEISEILGMSLSNVGTKISRIKEKLRKRFSQYSLE